MLWYFFLFASTRREIIMKYNNNSEMGKKRKQHRIRTCFLLCQVMAVDDSQANPSHATRWDMSDLTRFCPRSTGPIRAMDHQQRSSAPVPSTTSCIMFAVQTCVRKKMIRKRGREKLAILNSPSSIKAADVVMFNNMSTNIKTHNR